MFELIYEERINDGILDRPHAVPRLLRRIVTLAEERQPADATELPISKAA